MSITATVLATAITTGLAQGAIASVRDEAKALVKKITERFRDTPEVTAALTMAIAAPDDQASREELAQELDAHGVVDDPEIAQAAQQLVTALGQSASGPGAVAAGSITQNTGNGFNNVGNQTNNVTHHHTYPDSTNPDNAVIWQITPSTGSTYDLTNVGTHTAYDVTLDAPGAPRFDPPEYEDPTWYPYEPRNFGYVKLNGSPNVLVVRYCLNKDAGPQHTRGLHLPRT